MSGVEETEDDKKRKLLAAVRDKHEKEALTLLKEGAGVDFQDLTGCYPIHYAASAGYDDVIAMLLDKGANVMAWDNNGRTALHQAAMYGHARSIVTLVAGGAVVRTLDQNGCLALEYAVKNKHVTAVKLLCQFGSEPILQDWSWIKAPNIRKMKAEYEIAKTLKQQVRLIPGYRHTGIKFDVARLSPGKGSIQRLENTGVEVKVAYGQKSYYLYLSKADESYGSPPPLGPEEQVFGHLLECQTWGPLLKTITLTVTVDRVLRKNEEIVLRPKGDVDQFTIQGMATTVTITVPLERTGTTYFTVASREKKQIFKISKAAVVLKPEIEPEAEIDIPAGTFASGDLEVKFVDTTEAIYDLEQDSKDRGESGDDPILLTNILDICTTDGQKPQKDIQMKLPVNVTLKSKNVVVLTTSNPDPNLEKWDWEVIPAEIDGAGKAVFTVKHFSPKLVVSSSQYEADPSGVKDTAQEAVQQIRTVEFLVAVKTPEMGETKTDMIVVCGTKNKIKDAKRKYKSNLRCFSLEPPFNRLKATEGQVFKIVISGGTLQKQNDDGNLKITFRSSVQETALQVCSVETPDLRKMSGVVEIIADTKETAEVVDAGCCGFCCCKNTIERNTTESQKPSNSDAMCKIPFSIELTKRDSLRVSWDTLKDAVRRLSFAEGKHLGSQLGLLTGQITQLEKDTRDNKDFAMDVVNRWSMLTPKNDSTSELKRALEAMGRRDLIPKAKQEQVSHEEEHVAE